MIVSRLRLTLACLAAAAVALGAAPAALANTAKSANWAGYAAHRSRVKFRQVTGTWKLPSATCTARSRTFSSTWVGLGGFSGTFNALEQIGSEVDCNAHGTVVTSAWYELVPAPSHRIRKLKVAAGDTLRASVTVVGHTVTLALHDLTLHRSFTHTAAVSKVDVASADWIVEAPSECRGDSVCRVLPLADFGPTTFTRAQATTSTGREGSISSGRWNSTRVTLSSAGHPFVGNSHSAVAAQATVSPLSANGSSFRVTYVAASTPSDPQSGSVSDAPKIAHAQSRISYPSLIWALR